MSVGVGSYCKTVVAPECWKCYVKNYRVLVALAIGQVLSLCITGTGMASEFILRSGGKGFPFFQSLGNYALLSLCFTLPLCLKKTPAGSRHFFQCIREKGWIFFLVSICDIEANACLVKAYQLTTLTSVQLLDTSVVPFVMILSYVALGTRFLWNHYLGAILASAGVAVIAVADFLYDRRRHDADATTVWGTVIGDLLVIVGMMLYALSNVGSEYLTKTRHHGVREVIAGIGFFGFLVSGMQCAIFESSVLRHTAWNWALAGWLLLYTLCLFLVYTMLPLSFRIGSAAMTNLSLLTSDFYAVVLAVFVLKVDFRAVYIVAFVAIVLSIVTFNLRPAVESRAHKSLSTISMGSTSLFTFDPTNEHRNIDCSEDVAEGEQSKPVPSCAHAEALPNPVSTR